MKKYIKAIGIAAGLFIILMVLLTAAGIVYFRTEHARSWVQDTINQAIPGSISLKKMRFSPLNGRLALEKVLLKSPAGDDLAGCDRLLINISWLPLLHKTIFISESRLERPWALFRLGLDGKLDLVQAVTRSDFSNELPPKSPPDKTSSKPFNVVIASFVITNGSIDYQMPQPQTNVSLQDIGLTADANLLKKTGTLALHIAKASFKTPWMTTRIDPIDFNATLTSGRIDPLTCQIGSQALGLKVSGKINDILDTPFLDLVLEVDAGLAQLRNTLNLKPALSGHMAGHIAVHGVMNNPSVKLHLEYGGGILAGTRVDRWVADFHMHDRHLIFDHVQADVASGQLNLSGDIDLQRAFTQGFLAQPADLDAVTYRLHLQPKNIMLGKLFTRPATCFGTVNGQLNLEGRGLSWQTLAAKADFEARAEQLAAGSTPLPAAVLQLKSFVNIAKGLVELKEFSATAGDIHLEAGGHYDMLHDMIAAHLNLDAPNLDPILSFLDVKSARGNVRLKADLAGPLKEPAFSFLLNGNQLAVQHITIGDVTVRADLNPSGLLNVSRIYLKNQGSVIQGSGTVQIFENSATRARRQPVKYQALQADLSADALFLEDFVETLEGNVSLQARLNGTLKQPRGKVQLKGEQLDLAVQKLERISLAVLLDGEKARIEALQIVPKANESITGSGWIAFDKMFEFDLKSQGIALEHIGNIGQKNIAQGNLVFVFSAKGDLDHPRIHGNVSLQHLHVEGKPFQDVNLRLDLHNQSVQISGRVNFDLEGRYDLKKKDFSVNLIFDQTELAPYFKLVDREDLSGTLTANLRISGNTDAINQIESSADVSLLSLLYNGRALLRAENFNILTSRQEISIPGLSLVLVDRGKLEVRGKGSLTGPSDFMATGNIPLQVLNLFTEDIQNLSGELLIAARMEGAIRAPRVQADIVLEKIGFELPVAFQKLRDINGRIAVTPGAIVFEDIQGMLDTGRFDLAGQINIESMQLVDWNLSLKAARVPVVVPDTLDLVLNADLKSQGSPAKSILQGEVTLLEGIYYRNINLSLIQAVGRKQREPLPAKPKNIPAFLKNMAVNVTLNARQSFKVDNNLARLDIKPDLHLSGTPEIPIIGGRANVESGIIEYRRNKFVVKKGIVDFANPYKIEPLIDVESETRIHDWNITLKLDGTPDNLNFQLSSDPAEEEADIISLLLFRKTTRNLIQSEGAMTQSTESMLAEMISSTWGEEIKKASGLDIVEIETYQGGGETDPNRTRVTLGKELSQRMTIKYALESKNGVTVRRAISEYKLLENILVNGFQDNQGIFGGELKYRLEFR